jgi:microcystin-dependent protein
MPTGLHLWSRTAASNATADSSINWAEGQSPSSVNDSARAMMARIAEWRDDLGGLTTGGSSTAYTLSSNRVFTSLALMDKAIVTIVPHTTSGAAPTLNVDGLGAKQIRSATGVNVPSGALVSGTPYALIYINATTEFILLGYPNALQPTLGPCPVGSLMDFAGTSAPSGWLLCYGQAVSRTIYAALFAVLGTVYGSGDGSTTFNLPDCRGRLSAGKDDMGGSAASRTTTAGSSIDGATLGASGGAQNVTIAQANLPNVNFAISGITLNDPGHVHQQFRHDLGASGGGGNAVLDSAGIGNETARNTNSATTGITISNQGQAASGGSGTALNKMPPTIIFNKIIFGGV